MTKSAVVGRKEAFWVVTFFYLLGWFDNRFVKFSRGETSREVLFKKIKNHFKHYPRILFYPEGTRSNYKTLNSINEVKSKIKLGLLKSIYQDKVFPVQIYISSNKEKVFSAKSFSAETNVKINSFLSKEIHPKDFDTFEEFINEICLQWLKLWNLAYPTNNLILTS